MNHVQAQLFHLLINYGFGTKVLEYIPFEVTAVSQPFKNCCLLDSTNGLFALWSFQGQEASLAYQHQLLGICRQHKVSGFLYPIELTNGCTYSQLGEKSWFYVTKWQNFAKVSYRNPKHLQSMIDLIIRFRQTLSDFGLTFCHPDRKDARNLIVKTTDAVAQLRVFTLLAKHRLKPTYFDQLFLRECDSLINEAEAGKNLFKESAYYRLNMNITTQNINIGDFSRSNLRVNPDGTVFCLGLKNYRWDIPVIDLAELLVKTGRSNRWSMEWFRKSVDYYMKYYSISQDEEGILRAYLKFPWSMYRLISRYYFNRVEWPLSKFIEKFERLLKDETNRRDFVEHI